MPTVGSMIRRMIQLPLLLPFFLLSCKWLDATGASITVQNQTDKSIMVCDFSPLEDPPSFPVEIAAHTEYVFESGRFPE